MRPARSVEDKHLLELQALQVIQARPKVPVCVCIIAKPFILRCCDPGGGHRMGRMEFASGNKTFLSQVALMLTAPSECVECSGRKVGREAESGGAGECARQHDQRGGRWVRGGKGHGV